VNLVEVKGLDLAYEIALACPDIPFLFLEGWPLSHRLLEKVGRMRAGAANITWHGRVLDMRPIYKQTRLLLVPSQWNEAWGRVVVEAQFSGIPAIASDIGGLAKNVADAGRLLDADAPVEAWAEAVRSIWFDDAGYARASERAYRRAESYWKGAASSALRLLELPTGHAHDPCSQSPSRWR
jgi:glycosyltransferase involved in cell wall biosynthesis